MSLFEFLMVLVSLIIGLGIAEILTGIARAIRCRDSITVYWVHAILTTIIFIALLQQWWEIWGVRDTPQWTFPGLLMMLGGPVSLFLVSHLLFPEPMKDADFREYYYNAMRPVWWLAIFWVVIASSFRPLILGTDLFAADNLTSFGGILFFAVLAVSKNSIVHGIMLPMILTGILSDIMLISFTLG